MPVNRAGAKGAEEGKEERSDRRQEQPEQKKKGEHRFQDENDEIRATAAGAQGRSKANGNARNRDGKIRSKSGQDKKTKERKGRENTPL